MAELRLPARLRDVEAVKSVRTPAELRFTVSAGDASTRFLRGILQRKILGERCPVCEKVYVPPRGACPTDGVPTTEQVELPHVGTLVSFCVVNLQFYGSVMEIPYTCANVLLDGSDLPIMHLIQECPVDKVHVGMRVEAVWVEDDADLRPTLESIRYFRPNGEPSVEVHLPGEDWDRSILLNGGTAADVLAAAAAARTARANGATDA